MALRFGGLSDSARGRPTPPTDPATGRPQALSVTELTQQVKTHLETRFQAVWVAGEVSNFRRYESGHCYFTLKDAGAQLSCVLWRMTAEHLRFAPGDGQQVLAHGRVSVYEARGQYQLVVEHLEPLGLGALAAAFEALKAKLAAEGLFDEERKRPLPLYPHCVALVTSLSGAAIRDLLKVILRRWPKIELLLVPVRVQGEGAAQEIAEGIARVNRHGRADVMIVGRGGGSLEDLWAFNEETVARAIAASRIPVISAVGHEVDFTIADFVADVRAATPSQAGELVVPELRGVVEQLTRLRAQLPAALLQHVAVSRERLRTLAASWALRAPEERLQQFRQRVDELQERLTPLAQEIAGARREDLVSLAARLEGLSPLKVLERGYSVTSRESDGAVLRDAAAARPGERIVSRLARGKLISKVEERSEE
jgi:exodeoxyribonuclease VII large subunit